MVSKIVPTMELRQDDLSAAYFPVDAYTFDVDLISQAVFDVPRDVPLGIDAVLPIPERRDELHPTYTNENAAVYQLDALNRCPGVSRPVAY